MPSLNNLILKMTLLTLRLIAALFLTLLLACSNSDNSSNSPQKTKGTSDGGGGIITSSTKEEVREAILSVRSNFIVNLHFDEIANRENYAHLPKKNAELIEKNINNIYKLGFEKLLFMAQKLNQNITKLQIEYNQLQDSHSTQHTSDKSEYLKIENKIKSTREKIALLYNEHEQKDASSFNQFINEIELNLLETGSCQSEDKDHADASVSENSLEASICFSLENLSRLSKNALHGQIAGLWFHELAHMAELDETEAQQLERTATIIYENLIKKLHNYKTKLNHATLSGEALLHAVKDFKVSFTKYLKEKNSDNPSEQTIGEAYLKLAKVNSLYNTNLDVFINDYLNLSFQNINREELQKIRVNIDDSHYTIFGIFDHMEFATLNQWTIYLVDTLHINAEILHSSLKEINKNYQ